MSLNDDTTIRRRRGKRATVQVDKRVDSAGRGFQYRRQDLPPLGRIPTDTEIQITIVRTLTTVTTTSKASTTTTTSRSSTTTISSRSSSRSSSLPTSSLPTSESSESSESSLSTSSALPVTTIAIPPVSSVSTTSGNTGPSSADSNSTGSAVKGQGGLSSGAIAGIAITVVVVLAALIAFLVRRRMMANRAEKRSDWLDRSGFSAPAPPIMTRSYNPPPPTSFVPSSRPPPAPEPYNYGPPAPVSRLSYSRAPAPSFAISSAASSRPVSLIPGRRGPDFSAPSVMEVPFQSSTVPSQAPATPSSISVGASNVMAVRCTFIPSMADELSITTGETIRVLQEYDDGWALCLNDLGQQGMVPMECLQTGAETSPIDKPGLKRSSSLSGKS
ncbi:hypothetical protein L218DRAFT_498583 [Marasmius fiardii PR-910]|nr:hypothetical protein L218DRAFT_498583 [Marasmius fiardii PR-910]